MQEQKIQFEEKMNIFQNDIKSSPNIKLDELIIILNKEKENKLENNIEVIIYKILINYLKDKKSSTNFHKEEEVEHEEYYKFCHEQLTSFKKKIIQENFEQQDYLEIFRFQKNNFLKTELIIKYSIIKELINKLQQNENNDMLYYLMKLYQIDGMKQISVCILKKSFGQEKIDIEDIKLLNHILNAKFIFEILQTNNEKNIDELSEFISNFTFGNDYPLEKEYIQKIKKYFQLNFNIKIPVINPFDFIYLFINFDNEGNLTKGFILKENLSLDIYKKIKFIENKNKDSINYQKCYNEIIKILQKQDFNYKDIFEKFIQRLSNNFSLKFQFNDIDFIQEKFQILENEKIYNKYPSLVYYLIENPNEEYFSFIQNKTLIPFWLYCLRLECPINIIQFHGIEDSNFSSIINELIQNNLKNKIKKNEKIGINWLSLIGCNVPYEFKNIFLSDFHEFLITILKDKEFKINSTKNKIIKEIIKEIFNNDLDYLKGIESKKN